MRNAEPIPTRDDGRIIIHFDYDCFYASVFEKEDPCLKSLPFAVQQKQIIVTCNYEARKRGLYKLQLVREAKRKCPDLIIALGEDLTRFRNASKDNYHFLRSYTWSNQAERLGFDEVFLDVTDLVDYNAALLNHRDPSNSFFHIDQSDPTKGFPFVSTTLLGNTYPEPKHDTLSPAPDDLEDLLVRLRLGSHLAQYLRHELEKQKGYTSTVGISTNKLLAKLVGNVNKPKGQTTLLPPYHTNIDGESNVHEFIDKHDVGKIPGIGFKTAQRVRSFLLGRDAAFESGLVYGGTRENITVKDVRLSDGMGAKLLRRILEGPGVSRELPERIWGLINGIDDAQVGNAKDVPQQVSIEDSYIKLNEMPAVMNELTMLAQSLIKRMRLDLMTSAENDEHLDGVDSGDPADASTLDLTPLSRWIAYPKLLRLSTRARPPMDPDGTRQRNFARISRSSVMPSFVFNLVASVEDLAQRLVSDAIVPLFRKLHPESFGWDLSLVNLCATNMIMAASNGKDGQGRDIAQMFRKQDDVLKQWRVVDEGLAINNVGLEASFDRRAQSGTKGSAPDNRVELGSEDVLVLTQGSQNEDELQYTDSSTSERCALCGATMPLFALTYHESLHALE